jgi:hypothetical protein
MCCWRWWYQHNKRSFEVGGSAVFPVPEVVALALFGGTVAAGGLAVPVAHDERFPDRRWDGAGGAADVEDLGLPAGDDPAEVAVAGEPFEGGGGEVADLGSDPGFEFGGGAGTFVEVDDGADVGPDAVGFADLAAVEGAAGEVPERVCPPLGCAAAVVLLEVALPRTS